MSIAVQHPGRPAAVISAGLAFLVQFMAPAASHAASGDHFKQRGSQATADLFESDPCTSSSLFVSASSFVQKSEPGAHETANSVFVSFFQYDLCTGAYRSGSAFIENAASFDARLNSASASASLPTTTCTFDIATDSFECVDGPTLVMSIQWAKSGSSSRERSTSTFHNGDTLFRFRSNGTFADATLTPSVTLGGSALFDDPNTTSSFGSLSESSSASLVVIKN
jgi:hypothetical protein